MKQRILTDIELRAHWNRTRSDTYPLEEGALLTPAARDFVREHGIRLCPPASMTVSPLPQKGGRPVYRDLATGREMGEKPEDMTHLRGSLLVPKTHPRIEFRGRLDSLMADILELQLRAEGLGEEGVLGDLEELLAYTRQILAAEVKEEPLAHPALLGLDSAGIRACSHHVKEHFGIDHPIPSYRMGPVCVGLNHLRTRVREAELSAARAFPGQGGEARPDILEGLNRMSSCVYIILCRRLSGYYERENQP